MDAEEANAKAFNEDARLKIELRGDRVYSPNPSVDMKIGAGQFADNERLELFAYLVDVAGNVGGTAAAPQAANWKALHGTNDKLVADLPATGFVPNGGNLDAADDVTDGSNQATNVPIIGDATKPKITINYPNPDSIAAGSHDPVITAAITQTLSTYTQLSGEVAGGTRNRDLHPLVIKLSEGPSKITIKHADSTLTLDDYVIDDPDNPGTPLARDPTGSDKVAAVDFLNIEIPEDGIANSQPSDQSAWFTNTDDVVAGIAKNTYVAAGGTAGDIVITVWDSLGNKTEFKDLTGITLDGNTPKISNLFPTNATAPKDADNEDAPTIDPDTRNPVFIINEELDSLSIRYHEAGGGTAIVQEYRPGNSRLEAVGSLRDWAGERYHLHRSPEVRSGSAGVRPRGQRQRDEGRCAHVQRRL